MEDQGLLEDDASRIEGLIMTYVDDLFIAAVLKLVNAVIDGIRQLWATTQPEFVSRIRVRFLGMEVSRVQDGTEVIWKVTQQSYLTDLLQKHPEVRHRKIPITRDQGFKIEEEEEKAITVEAIRRAQKVVGELLWTVTRSRPDAMFAVAKMGSGTLRCPGKVCEVGDQVKGYLKETWADGLMFPGNCGENDLLEVFTDASFGDQSYGCVMVLLHGSPVLWKCGRQSTSSLSTAESELQEIIDGMTAGESTYSVACEVFGDMKRILWTDSQSAMSIMSSEGGSWRTRHLRLKSAHARARLQTGELAIRHLPGERMISDIGTKPLTSSRILTLKKEMGMWVESERSMEVTGKLDEQKDELQPEAAKDEQMISEDLNDYERSVRAEKILRLLTLAAVLQVGRGDDLEGPLNEGADGLSFEMFLVIYTIAVVAISAGVTWSLLRKGHSVVVDAQQQTLEEPLIDDLSMDEPNTEQVLREVDSALDGNDQVLQEEASDLAGSEDGSTLEASFLERPQLRGGVETELGQRSMASSEAPPLWRGEPRLRWRGEIEIRGRRIQSPRGFPVFFTRYGDRYHDCEACSSLSRSTLTTSSWCQTCLFRYPRWWIDGRPTIWSHGQAYLVHVDRACDFDLGRYEHCQICQRGGR